MKTMILALALAAAGTVAFAGEPSDTKMPASAEGAFLPPGGNAPDTATVDPTLQIIVNVFGGGANYGEADLPVEPSLEGLKEAATVLTE